MENELQTDVAETPTAAVDTATDSSSVNTETSTAQSNAGDVIAVQPYRRRYRNPPTPDVRSARYQKNLLVYRASAVKRVHKRQVKNRAILNGLKTLHGCSRCDEDHVAALTFHHLNPAEKICSINAAMSRGFPFDKVLAEVRKCIVLCFNCHHKLHYEERQAAEKAVA